MDKIDDVKEQDQKAKDWDELEQKILAWLEERENRRKRKNK